MSYDIKIDRALAVELENITDADDTATLRYTPAWTERVFMLGDRVTIYGDSGDPMPAEIVGVWEDGVRVRYQVTRKRPDGFTTSLPKSSVTTGHKVEHPAKLEVL